MSNPDNHPNAVPAPSIRVAMVEDDAACRTALVQAVAASSGLRMAWTAASRKEALVQLRGPASLDVLLVDLGLPDGSGLEVISAARDTQPECAVMVSTMFGDETNVLRAIEAGAMGYLLKDLRADELVAEIRSLHAGGSPINPMVARKLLTRQRAPAQPLPATPSSLSTREAEVLQLVAHGYTVDEVATKLAVSPHTVQTFVRRIYTKLQVGSRAEAIREGTRQGWIASAP